MLLFIPEEGKSNDVTLDLSGQREEVMKEKSAADIQHSLEVLSSDLKSSNGLTSRRIVQTTGNTVNIRLLKNAEKTFQLFRLREENILLKIYEEVTINQTTNLSSLLCRMGYHIYALRKIII